MRLVQVTIPAGKREAVLDTLDDQGIDYVLTDEVSGREYTAVAYVPLPTNAVEDVLDTLRDAGIERDAYTVVLNAETVVSERFEALEERYAEEKDEDRIAREELEARAEELAPSVRTYAIMTVVSVVIATAGLLLDSPSVVVGSMVIAPLIGPAMATTVGTVLDDRDLFLRGLKLQVLGFSLAIVTAALFALFVRYVHLVPPGIEILAIEEIGERVTPDFLSLAIALGAGVAGALSLRSGVSASLVGVMIAVALVPPAAAVGIGIAWGAPTVIVGSGVLVLVNAISINLAALATFWYGGYRPERWFRLDEARTATLYRVLALVLSLLVLSAFLGSVTYASYRSAEVEQSITGDVETVVENSGATVVGVSFVNDESLLARPFDPQPERVIVTVGVDPDATYPDLAARIRRRVTDDGGPTVEVRFVEVQTAETVAGVDSSVERVSGYSSKGSSGSYPIASTAASRTASTLSSSATLM
ncbi:MAG: putative hydrophobic protein (TIGR00341 family) [Halobacteriales archaeon]